jgi:hypothetical protein
MRSFDWMQVARLRGDVQYLQEVIRVANGSKITLREAAGIDDSQPAGVFASLVLTLFEKHPQLLCHS